MKFPSFYAECAYRDGQRDAAAGHSDSRPSFMRHGYPEPIGMHWYNLGRQNPSHTPAHDAAMERPLTVGAA